MPAVTFSGPNGAAIVSFTEDIAGTNDNLILRRNGSGQLEYSFNGGNFTNDLKSGTPNIQSLAISAIARIDVTLAGGNDTLTLDFSNGQVIPTSSGISFLGASGTDRIVATRDTDMTLTNTSLTFAAGGTVSLSSVEAASLTGGNSPNRIDCSSFTAGGVILHGGAQADTIFGGAGDDLLFGDNGNDLMYGGDGNDTLDSTNSGTATLFGGGGNDLLLGGNGQDSLTGDAGDDTLRGGNGQDALFGGEGNDNLEGGSGNDAIDGGNGADTVVATGDVNFTLTDSLLTGLGTDTLTSIEKAVLTGGAGNHDMDGSGFSGDLTMNGGGGNDTLIGGSGANTFIKTANSGGDTTMIGGSLSNSFNLAPSGSATLFDGSGFSTVSFADSQTGININFSLDNGAAQNVDGAGFMVSLDGTFENFVGSAFADTAIGNSVDNVMFGGLGPDMLSGGDGDDTLFGGTSSTASGVADQDTNPDTLFGGLGADYLDGGAGDDSLFGGTSTLASGVADQDSNPDTLFGGLGSDYLEGGNGDDSLFGGTSTTASGVADLDSNPDTLFGGLGSDLLDGGAGDDSLFGGTSTLASGVADQDSNPDSLFGGLGSDYLEGGNGDDSLFGGTSTTASGVADLDSNPDTLFGGLGSDLLSGGNGDDSLFGGTSTIASGVADLDTNPDTLFGGLGTDRLEGGNGDDSLFGGTASGASGVADLDNSPDTLFGQGGNDLLSGAGGNDVLNGGDGNDRYLFSGLMLGSDSIIEAPNVDTDTLDFSAFTAGSVNVNIGVANTTQIVNPSNLSLTFSSDTGIENVVGSRFADTITGNGRDNLLTGSAAISQPAPSTWNGVTQFVFLDFDTFTDLGEHVYTPTERDAIQSRIAADYAPFHAVVTQNPGDLPSGPYATLFFNKTPVVNGMEEAGGLADEVDFGNINLGGTAAIDVNKLLGGVGEPAPTSSNFIALTANVGAHELGHLMGLEHLDSAGPIGHGIPKTVKPGVFLPDYPGPTDAYETYSHIMASPASVGETLGDATSNQFFGEREAVKLAFANSGTTLAEQLTLHDSIATAQAIALAGLSVPNTLVSGLNWGLDFAVSAVAVTGSIGLTALGASQDDYYSFTGQAGDLVNLEIYSRSMARIANPIDSVLRVYNSSGALIAYYNGAAINDDSLETQDSRLVDLVLPSSGTFFVQVDTFTDANVPDTDTGDYELFLYRFTSGNATDQGDTLDGQAGNDTLIGGLGDDALNGGAGNNNLNGGAGNDRVVDAGDVNFVLADSSLAGVGSNSLTSIEQATLTGGPSSNSFQVDGWTGTALLDGGLGSDTLVGANSVNTWNVTANNAGNINGTIGFTSVENLTGGTAADSFAFGNGVIVSAVDGGAGADTLSLAGYTTDLTWNLTANNIGNVAGMSFGGIENLTGGSGVDLFNLANGVGVSGGIDGGAALVSGQEVGNFLNYSAYSTSVSVNLTSGSATGVALGVSRIAHVFGGAAADTLTGNATNNILIGNGGADLLSGLDGRDFLIGGIDADSLDGGNDDDILIGGTTAFDNQKQPLLAILKEWSRTDANYTVRTNHLTGATPGGLNGSTVLTSATVFDDNKVGDTFWGRGGIDWFFTGVHDDVQDKQQGEIVVKL